MRFDLRRAGALLLLALSSPALAQGGGSPETYIELNSEPGDVVGSGLQWFYSEDSSQFSYGPIGTDIGYAWDLAVFVDSDPFSDWSLDFADESGARLQPGEYEGVVKFGASYDSHAMDVGPGSGSNCTFLTGRFVVWAMQPFVAIDFEQHCEGASAALFGRVRIAFIAANMPVANAGGNRTLVEHSAASLDGRASTDNGSITAYRWTQQAGPPVTVLDPDSARLSIPELPAAPATLMFRLQVTDNEGCIDFDTVVVNVIRKEPDIPDYIDSATSAGGALGPAGLVLLLLVGLARNRRRA